MDGNKSTPKLDFAAIQEVPLQSQTKMYIMWIVKATAVLLGIGMLLTLIIGLVYFNNFKKAYHAGLEAKALLEQAQHEVINREFEVGAATLTQAHTDLETVKYQLDAVPVLRYMPYVGQQLRAVDQLAVAGIALTSSGAKLVTLAGELAAPLKNESITYSSLTKEQKTEIISKVVESRDLLFEVQSQLATATGAIQKIRVDGLVPQLRSVVEPLQELLPQAQLLIDNALPLVDILPRLVGIGGEQSYFFLIQNDSELRPTGGFIGTYGILKLQDAGINEFKTDNIYNIDLPAAKELGVPTPWQLEKYLEQKDWGLRDYNWDPDFPTTAQAVVEHYNKLAEIQHAHAEEDLPIAKKTAYIPETFDGVIAVTPEPIQRLLAITGPVTVQGILFTEDNLKDELEFRVGKEFKDLGIDESNRKEIIRQLAEQIQNRLFSLPYHQLLQVAEIGVDALTEKQVQLYSFDPNLEQLILDRGWGGEIQTTDSDYLLVVDANLASLKTDPYVDRTVSYIFNRRGKDVIATIKVTYKNNANFTWKTSRLRTYTRVYVPLGSELISHDGLMDNDKTKGAQALHGDVAISEEHGKTVFGGFISTEPGETNSFTYVYKLPGRIADQIDQGSYNLLVQKQSGNKPKLTLDLDFGTTIRSASPAEDEKEFFNSRYTLTAEVNRDRWFTVKLK